MKLWIEVEQKTLASLQDKGFLSVSDEWPVDDEEVAQLVRAPMDWVRAKYRERVDSTIESYPFVLDDKPHDLEWLIESRMPGEYAILELEIPDAECMGMDFHAWMSIYSDCPLSRTPAEQDDWFAMRDNDPLAAEELKLRTWEQAFHPEELTEFCSYRDRQVFAVGAVLWSQVVSVTPFTGRHKESFYGPNPIGPDDLPAIEGHGDTLRVGDAFLAHDADGLWVDKEPKTLCGYETDEKGRITMYAKTAKGHTNFMLANPELNWGRRLEKLDAAVATV